MVDSRRPDTSEEFAIPVGEHMPCAPHLTNSECRRNGTTLPDGQAICVFHCKQFAQIPPEEEKDGGAGKLNLRKEFTDAIMPVGAEFLSQIMFNYGINSCVATANSFADGVVAHLLIVLFHFFWLFLMVTMVGNLSGAHFNPMVSTIMAVHGDLKWIRLPFYIAAQVAGGVIGSLIHWNMLPGDKQNLTYWGGNDVPLGSSVAKAFLGEALAGFVLILVIIYFALEPTSKNPPQVPLAVGIVVALLVYVVGPVSSMCCNPARAFGPAVAAGHWQNHWIFWTAPFVGGLAAMLPYKLFVKGSEWASQGVTPS